MPQGFSFEKEIIPLASGERRTVKLHFSPEQVRNYAGRFLLKDESDTEAANVVDNLSPLAVFGETSAATFSG